MKLFKLLQGLHVQAQLDWAPTEEEKALAKEQGVTLTRPTVTYKAGDTVPNERDLCAKFGTEKFQYVGEEGTVHTLTPTQSVVTPGSDPNRQTTAAQPTGPLVPKPACPTDQELNKMSVQDLRSLAEDEEIAVGPNLNKNDLIKAIKAGW